LARRHVRVGRRDSSTRRRAAGVLMCTARSSSNAAAAAAWRGGDSEVFCPYVSGEEVSWMGVNQCSHAAQTGVLAHPGYAVMGTHR
jgi:hypothetical protein